jgi:crotonobetainyl-CoA:carnitine CoA-transferase CaiB-like acyl-CoA transferase
MNDPTVVTMPLAGVRVIEAATYISGPLAGMALAQLGADVVKVEGPHGGDPARRFGLRHEGLSALWVNLNHGKRSITLDLKSSAGHARMTGLLSGADVFIQNWRPGVARRLGLSPADVRAANQRLVYLAITGVGDSGPYARVPSFDSLIQALSGLMWAESPDGTPAQLRSYLADKTAAMMAVQVILAALVQRERTGDGCRIDLPMLDAMAYFNFPDLGQDRTFLAGDGDVQLARTRSCCVRTSDGYVALAPVAGRQIRGALEAVGHPEWSEQLKSASPAELTQRLFDLLETITPTRDSAYWLRAFADRDVPAAPVPDMDQHFSDLQVRHNNIYGVVNSDVGPLRTARYPGLFDGRPLEPAAPPPIATGGGPERGAAS